MMACRLGYVLKHCLRRLMITEIEILKMRPFAGNFFNSVQHFNDGIRKIIDNDYFKAFLDKLHSGM